MTTDLIQWLTEGSGAVIYYAVSLTLLLGAVGLPVPEDIPLLLAGVAASKDLVSTKYIFLTCYFGVVLADQLVYLIGYSFGKKLLSAGTKSLFFPSITEDRVNEIRTALRQRHLLYIFISRHLFPIRSVTFLTAGALRIPFLEFLLADALAALISVTIVFSIGYYLGEKLSPDVIEHLVSDAHYYIVGLVALVLLLWICSKKWKRYKKKKAISLSN